MCDELKDSREATEAGDNEEERGTGKIRGAMRGQVTWGLLKPHEPLSFTTLNDPGSCRRVWTKDYII